MRMDCTEAKRVGMLVLAGDALPDQAERLQAHLRTCAACAADWQKLKTVAEMLQAAAPPALETQRDLVREAMQQVAAGPEPQAVRLRARYRLVAWGGAALVVLAAAIVMLPRPSRSSHLLAIVEAATAVRPTHEVSRTFDADGNLVGKTETWYSPAGDCYQEVEDFAREERVTLLQQVDARVRWSSDSDRDEYSLHWDVRAWAPPVPARPDPVPLGPAERIPGVRSPEVLDSLAWLRSMGAPFGISDSTGHLREQEVRIIEVALAQSAISKGQASFEPMTLRYYLTPDGSRLVGKVLIARSADKSADFGGAFRVETWPIEYDTEPPSSLFEARIPEGASATLNGEPIDRLWESMSGTEQGAIRETALGLLRAWSEGDVEAFDSYCDFTAGLNYAVKVKFTAEQIRDRSLELVAEQKTRFADQQWTMDYAYETTRPPERMMVHWHIRRTNPQSDGNWILLRQRPIEEPGIVVLARGQVTTHEGEVGYLGMYLFLKKIGGTYKLVLWREPFGGYGY